MKNKHKNLITLYIGIIILVLTLNLLPDINVVEAEPKANQTATMELVVKYKQGYLPAHKKRLKIFSLHKDLKLGLERVRVAATSDLEAVINAYQEDPNVEYVHLNHTYKVSATPNDPHYANQWYLGNIQTEAAWEVTKGKDSIIVAVLDTGVDLAHPDLNASLVAGWDFLKNNDSPQDENGHGTHVAGVIAGAMNNDLGIVGIAPEVYIMPVRVIGSNGLGNDYDIARGIRYAVDHGAKILNLSFGNYEYSHTLESAINYAHNKGAVLVAAAGNDNLNKVYYPAKFNNVIAVSATNEDNDLANFSNYGPEVELSAPGEQILSTWLDDGEYAYMDGTSAAAPIVSAVAALIWSKNDKYYNFQIRETLRKYSDDLGEEGKDNKFGYGKINAFKAVSAFIPKTFKDIQGHWAQGDIEFLAFQEVVTGYGTTDYFAPQGKVTRAEFTTLLVRALGLEEYYGEDIQFKDVSSAWYTGYVKAAAKAGMVKGYNDGSFAPLKLITRQEMAAMIIRAVELQEQKVELEEVEQDLILSQYDDSSTVSVWARQDLAKAIKSGIIQGVSQTTLAPMNNAIRAEAAAVTKRMMDDPNLKIQ